jgi:transcriptional regulator with XRE-family HTH domain
MKTFGKLLKQHRQRLELSLREFCNQHGFDHGNYSKLERGIFQPPQNSDKLEAYALALDIKRGSAEWFDFFDLAATGRGHIPADIMSDESVVEKLPVLFRTIRSQKITSEQLDELIDKIKET